MQKQKPISLQNSHVKLLAFDLLSLTPNPYSLDPSLTFNRRGIPLTRAETVGTVTLRDHKPNRFLRFAIDDGTGCIPCILWLNHVSSPHLARHRSPQELRRAGEGGGEGADHGVWGFGADPGFRCCVGEGPE
ncbi:CST complex subunit STN1-like [Lotus japonicus]|uniref:CST complex subunit STN1-like n=1 Tax=Lotus japonicus TaxID=34305 RepID=UPI00258D186B|nr:CST complex subunit STN1-like [Lotus japonicus]